MTDENVNCNFKNDEYLSLQNSFIFQTTRLLITMMKSIMPQPWTHILWQPCKINITYHTYHNEDVLCMTPPILHVEMLTNLIKSKYSHIILIHLDECVAYFEVGLVQGMDWFWQVLGRNGVGMEWGRYGMEQVGIQAYFYEMNKLCLVTQAHSQILAEIWEFC